MGWIGRNQSFIKPLEEQNRHFLKLWLDSRDKSPKEYYSGIKSFILFLQDTQKLCLSKGECYAKWFDNIIADEDYLATRISEMNDLKNNFLALENEFNLKSKYEPTLQHDLFQMIKNNPGIIQSDIYKQFPSVLKNSISESLYHQAKNGEIRREKSGNSYRIYIS